jgi:hypothetical protein
VSGTFVRLGGGGRVQPSATIAEATKCPIVPAPDDDDDDDEQCGKIGGILGRINRSIRRRPATMPLCPPQIPHALTMARNLAAAVVSRRLTTLSDIIF